MTKATSNKPSQQSTSRIHWRGRIKSVQCRAWGWRYKTDSAAESECSERHQNSLTQTTAASRPR